MNDTEALKALVAMAQKFRSGRWMIVSDWNRYAVMEENHPHERFVCTFNQKPVSMQGRKLDPVDYCGADRTTAEFIAAAKNVIPALERMLASQGEQREAQGAERPQGEVHALPHSPPPVPEVLAPVYRFLIGRCLYWKLLIGDDAELPEAPWYGIVQIQIKRSGKLEYCEAKYEAPLFGGPPQWSSWNASEGNYEVLKWLKQWNLPINVAPPLAEPDVEAAALEIYRSYVKLFAGWDKERILKEISAIIRKHLRPTQQTEGEWVRVPREPTRQMLKDGSTYLYPYRSISEREAGEIYGAMIAAAPDSAREGEKP